MWFLFGFITLISFSIYFAYKRINAAWKGVAGNTNGVSYQYALLKNKSTIIGLLLGIEGASGYDFSFKKETWYDRLSKFIGLSAEYQAGNKDFDNLVYVVSDDAELLKQISTNISTVEMMLDIFSSGENFNCKIKEVRCNSGRLWVKFKTTGGFEETKVAGLAAFLVPLLQNVSNELAKVPPIASKKWRDPFVVKAAIILAISTGLAINGLVHLLRLQQINEPFTVDTDQLLLGSAYWGAGIIISLLIATIIFLGRSARTHLVLIELLIVGSFGAASTSFTELRDINIELDQTPGTEYQAKTLGKTISKGRRSTSYYLYMEDWNKEESQKKVKVSSDFYHQTSVGDHLIILQKNGCLKYRWVERIDKKT